MAWFRRLLARVRARFWPVPVAVQTVETPAHSPSVAVAPNAVPVAAPKTRIVVLCDEDRLNPRRVEIPIPKNSLRIKVSGFTYDRFDLGPDGLALYEPMKGQLQNVGVHGSAIH